MKHFRRPTPNVLAIVGIIATMMVVLGFDVYATRASNAALSDLRERQRASDEYAELQILIVGAEAAFYEATLYPNERTLEALDDSIAAAFKQSMMISSMSREDSARVAESMTKYGPAIQALQEALASGAGLASVHDQILSGTGLVDGLVEETATNAAIAKAEADAMAADFEHSQDLRLLVAAAVNGVGILLVAWLAIAIRRFSRREIEMQSLAEAHRLLEISNAEAERASRAKSEFLSRMSHELRTPMNAVLGFGQLLQLDELSSEQRENVDYIMSSGRHLLRLIDEVLDISRIEAGKLDLSLEPFDPSSVLAEVVEMIRPIAAASAIELEVHPAPPDVRAVGDVQRTKQVLLNLLSNAVKYNRPGGSVKVRVDADAGERVRFAVSDTGHGIAADRLQRLFSPFDRLDAEKSGIEGTGLGLALSRVLAEAMSGCLTVESVEGAGSTFTVELPAALGAAAAHLPGQAVDSIASPMAVLYVEDNLANFGLVERALRQHGDVRLLAARTGAEGIALAREWHPGLVLLDYHLPDMTGLDVLELLKKDDGTSAIPIVMLSASTSGRVMEQARALGAAAVLSKPIDLPHLFATIARVAIPQDTAA